MILRLVAAIASFIDPIAAYFAGGQTGASTAVSAVDRLALPSETRSSLGTGLSSTRYAAAGFTDPRVAGYAAGGYIPGSGQVTTVDKFGLPGEARSTLGTGLAATNGWYGTGVEDPGVAGLVIGGAMGSGSSSSAIRRFEFPTDTASNPGAFVNARYGAAGISDHGVAGYAAGGYDDGGATNLDTIEKIAFPALGVSVLAATLSSTRWDAAGFTDPGVAGYIAGGSTGGGAFSGMVSTVQKLALPADTLSTLGTGLSAARQSAAGTAHPEVAGYVAGGFDSGPTRVDTIDRFAMPTDTRSTLAAVLSADLNHATGFSTLGG